jgi:hypothetical protein
MQKKMKSTCGLNYFAFVLQKWDSTEGSDTHMQKCLILFETKVVAGVAGVKFLAAC